MLRFGWAISILARQRARALGKFAIAHALEQVEVFRDGPIAERAIFSWRGERAAVLANLIGVQIAHIGVAGIDQCNRPGVNLLKIVAGIEWRRHVEAQPAHVLFDRFDVFLFFLGRVGVVEAQIAGAIIFDGQAEIQADAFGVADVQIAIGLRRKSRLHSPAKAAASGVHFDDFFDEIQRARFVGHERS